jgi:predicted DNA-binding transcriptional regulator AlpA
VTKILVEVPAEPHARILLKDARRLRRLSRSKIYLLINEREFLAPVKVGHSSRRLAAEVRQHMAAEEAAR